MARLRQATGSAHEALERTLAARALLEGRVTPWLLASQLACFERLHAGLDAALAASERAVIRRVWRPTQARHALLVEDLRVWAARGVRPDAAAAASLDPYLKRTLRDSAARPCALLGPLYVMEGATLGGRVIIDHLEATLELTSGGASYYRPYPPGEHGAAWKGFKQRMDAALTAPAAQEVVIEAAQACFAALLGAFEALSERFEAGGC